MGTKKPGGEGVAFESVRRLAISYGHPRFSLPPLLCFLCFLSHTHTSAHANSCMLGNVVQLLLSACVVLFTVLSALLTNGATLNQITLLISKFMGFHFITLLHLKFLW